MKKYYLAYEERYKKIHGEGLLWFSGNPTPEVANWIDYNKIPDNDEICEVGCGEGRDAFFLSRKGYKITAIDASESAISKCRELSDEMGLKVKWEIADALYINEVIQRKFKWVYSVGVLHMLVEDDDRKQFLSSLYKMLEPEGKLLLINMGDGVHERKTDTSTAFELQKRNHMATGRSVMVAGTSYRDVNWDHHKEELSSAGFVIEKAMSTENNEYGNCMTIYLSRR